jgi:hypothetical protein
MEANMVAAHAGLVMLLAALGQGTPAERGSDLDQAIALLNEARQSFARVRDYECRVVLRERVKGMLLPQSVAKIQVRNDPYSVHLWCEGPANKGMEICYIAGRNDGMMRVHPTGVLGLLGFFTIDPRDPRALEKNRHPITEAGLGNLLESTARYWEREKIWNRTLVRISEDAIAARRCTRIETIHPDRSAGPYYGYRCVLWLDRQTHLPVGAETYDWPVAQGPAEGELLESYRFLELRCNLSLSDDVFNH